MKRSSARRLSTRLLSTRCLPRRALLTVVAAGSLLLVSGCGLLSPTTTNLNYEPGNGVSAVVGDVLARDLLVVGTKGSPGLLSGALVNNGTSAQQVTITSPGQPQPVQVQVPAGGLVTLGGPGSGASVVLGNLTKPDGALMEVILSSPSGGQTKVTVPILAPTLEYATVTPTRN